MTFAGAIRACFSKYATFSGRASRSEYWWWMLFYFVAVIVLSFVDGMLFGTTTTTSTSFQTSTDTPILSMIFILAILLPSLSVAVRRLHDKNRSGWWYWLFVVPIVGIIIMIYWFATRGTIGPNDYGDDPLGGEAPGGEAYASSSVPHVARD